MPRTTGVSSRITDCRSLRSPRERTVSFCVCWLPMGLRRRVILSLSDMQGRLLQLLHPGRELFYRLGAQLGHIAGALELSQGLQGGPGDVDGVGRAKRLAQHIAHARQLQDGADAAARHDARTGRGWLEHYLRRALVRQDLK